MLITFEEVCLKRIELIVSAALLVGSLGLIPVSAQSVERGIGPKRTGEGERPVALVIGNSQYQDAPLTNPANDARDMIALLDKLGFVVLSGVEADLKKMNELIEDFGRQLKRGGVGLFYFAGHGMQIDGENYLVPIGARIEGKAEVRYQTIPVGVVLAKMEDANNGLNVIILDACRNNPFSRSFRSSETGLAKIAAPTGTLIAYATQPGNVASDGSGRNGLYTGELLAHLRVPGRSIEDVFKFTRVGVAKKTNSKQVPYLETSAIGDFYPNGGKPADGVPQLSPEEAEWQVVSNSPDPADVRDFLSRYPNSKFATAARVKLKQMPELPAANNTGQNSAGSGTSPAALYRTAVPESITLAANRGWMQTGIQVKQGEKVDLRANGDVTLARLGSSRADGIPADDPAKPAPNCATGALIARIGNGSVICVQQRKTFIASDSGELWVSVNAGNVQKNTGVFNLNITVSSPVRQTQ